jgi:hypothetical protein
MVHCPDFDLKSFSDAFNQGCIIINGARMCHLKKMAINGHTALLLTDNWNCEITKKFPYLFYKYGNFFVI